MRYCSVTRNVTYIMPFISHHSLRNPCILHAIACDLLTINNFVIICDTMALPPVRNIERKYSMDNQTSKSAQMRNISPETKRAASLYKRLSPADRQLIIALLKSLSSKKE